MSTGLELLPLALAIGAAVAAVRKRRSASPASPIVVTLGTRMRDGVLLSRALDVVGRDFGEQDGVRHGSIQGMAVAFTVDTDGTFEAHFDATLPSDQAQALVAQLDEQYARLVQQQVYEKLLERAPAAGLVFESERVEEDDSIVVTLLVGEEGRA